MSEDHPDKASRIAGAFAQGVKGIPQSLVDAYVPKLKAYHRALQQFNITMWQAISPYDAELEQIGADFRRDHPAPAPGTPAYIQWELDSAAYVETVFAERHPGFFDAYRAIPDAYEERLTALEAACSLQAFMADGGTEEQYQELSQAMLEGVFSRQAPSAGWADQPVLH